MILFAFHLSVLAAAGPYDETANATQNIKSALAEAKAKKKLVLIQFGTNRCADCLALDKGLKAGKLSRFVDSHFVVVHVDVGDSDRNMDIVQSIGNPIAKGMPAVVVTRAAARLLSLPMPGSLPRRERTAKG